MHNHSGSKGQKDEVIMSCNGLEDLQECGPKLLCYIILLKSYC